MPTRVCLIHYHEIGLKGKNRITFERRLRDNLEVALAPFGVTHVGRISGHLLATFADESRVADAAAAAARVPGVARVSQALRCNQDEAEYCAAAITALGEVPSFETFKVHARRSSTNYPLHTLDMNRLVGSALCEAFPDKKVLMHGPDVTVVVLATQGDVYVYASSQRGVGGLPVGSAGKVVSLFSSGIDSPVATWMIGRRGAVCVPVHFSGRPQTSDASEWLVQDIVRALGPAGIIGRLYVCPIGDFQRQIALAVPNKLRVVMYRRLMFRVAEGVARIEGAKALVTGESLGQVASQTLENINAVNEVVSLPVFRPLIGSDKQEIIERAQQIGTFDLSTSEAPDCCTLFMPRKPETHARIAEVHEAEAQLDMDAMVAEALSVLEYVDFEGCPSYHRPHALRRVQSSLAPAGWHEDLMRPRG